MLRLAALLGLVVVVAALSRLSGHPHAHAAAGTSSLPLPRAATVAERGMSEARVRLLAGEPVRVGRYHGERCLTYLGNGVRGECMFTVVCLDRKKRVSRVESARLDHSVPPPAF